MVATTWAECASNGLTTFTELARTSQGQFAAGALLGSVLATTMHWFANRQNRQAYQLIIARESELNKQLQIRDDRINKLHDELDKCRKKNHR